MTNQIAQSAAKDSPRIEAYGVVEELNVFVGAARALAEETTDRNGKVWPLVPFLLRIQHELSNLGECLANVGGVGVTSADIARLDHEWDRINCDLPVRHSLVLPGSGLLNASLHQCRAVCRRAERATIALSREERVPPETLRYLDRLSAAFLAWSRWASHACGEEETLWDPHHSAM